MSIGRKSNISDFGVPIETVFRIEVAANVAIIYSVSESRRGFPIRNRNGNHRASDRASLVENLAVSVNVDRSEADTRATVNVAIGGREVGGGIGGEYA